MSERKRKIGQHQEYPGAYAWPIFEILCPHCNKWSQDYGTMQTLVEGQWVDVCGPCEEKIDFPPLLEPVAP